MSNKKRTKKIEWSTLFPGASLVLVLLPPILAGIITVVLISYKGGSITLPGLLLETLGGVQAYDNIIIMDFLRWVMLVSPLVLLIGLYIDRETSKRLPFVLIRSRSYASWWYRYLFHLILVSLLYCLWAFMSVALIALLLSGGVVVKSEELKAIGICLGMFAFYNVLVSLLQAFLQAILHNNKIIITVILGLPVLAQLLGSLSHTVGAWFPGSWGMYLQSYPVMDQGYNLPVVLFIGLLVILGIYVIGAKTVKNNGVNTTENN